MSPCCGSVCLLVLLGVVLASGGPVQFVSENMKQTHESIADVLKLKSGLGHNPLFSSVMKSINTSCQRKEEIQLMNVTLDIYMRIFSSILQSNHDEAGSEPLLDHLSDSEKTQVRSDLTKLQKKMEKLKSHLGQLNTHKEDVLSKLNKIQVDDPLVQRKALAEYKEIYQAASVIGARSCGHAHLSSSE